MNRRCEPAGKKDARGTKSGVALVLILLLVGVVATLTISVQMSLILRQRHTQTERRRTELRTAAADAAWCFLRDRVRTSPATGGALPAAGSAVLPSGVETRVDVTDNTDQYLGAIPLPGDKAGGRVYLLRASASTSNAVEQVSCIYRRNKGGAVEVLGWCQER